MSYPVKFNDPHVLARVDYWWERNLARMAVQSGKHWKVLKTLLQPPASETRLADLVWPTT